MVSLVCLTLATFWNGSSSACRQILGKDLGVTGLFHSFHTCLVSSSFSSAIFFFLQIQIIEAVVEPYWSHVFFPVASSFSMEKDLP